MYRIASEFLIQPWFLGLCLSLLWLGRLMLGRTASRRELAGVILCLGVTVSVSTPAAAWFAGSTLQDSFPERYDRPADAEAIVVLGGYLRPPSAQRPKAQLGWDSLSRCLLAADLYRQGPACPLLLTGGQMDPTKPGPTISQAMEDFMSQYGIPPESLLLDVESQSTFENAEAARAILEPLGIHRVLLVTDAIHLRRAKLCFEQQGFEVVPRGCNYAGEFEWTVFSFLPSPDAAAEFQRVVHEWVGLMYYRARGRL